MAVSARPSGTSVYLRTRLKLTAVEGVREAVLAGPGFAIASRWMFAAELESGEVASVLDEWTLPPLDLWVIYPSGRLTSVKARAFIKWFEKALVRQHDHSFVALSFKKHRTHKWDRSVAHQPNSVCCETMRSHNASKKTI